MYTASKAVRVKTANMPPFLTEDMLNEWAEKTYLNSGSVRIPTLTVSFSNERKEDTYGVFSMEEAKREVRKLFPQDRGVKSWLDECLSPIETREELKENAEKLAACPMAETEFDRHEAYMRIKEIADAIEFTVVRLGEYCHERREIVLYADSILNSRRGMPAEEKFEETFIHEYFHAYHYHALQSAPKNGDISGDSDICLRSDMTRRVVLESLASYFENLYCEGYGISADLPSVWAAHEPSVYPYAGAKYIRDDAECKEIIQASTDLDAALRKLLLDQKGDAACRQFYLIKNGIAPARIRTRVLTVKVPACPQDPVGDVIDHCRTELGAAQALKSNRYFNTQKMREFFARHGESIGDKLRIVCQKESDKIVIYLETKGKSGSSAALDSMRADSRFKAEYGSGRQGKEFSTAIPRVTLIHIDAMKDGAGNPRPLSAVTPAIDPNLRIFRDKLLKFERLLDTL